MFYFFPFRQVVGTRIETYKEFRIIELAPEPGKQVFNIIPAVLSMFTSALGEVDIQRMSEAIREFVHKLKNAPPLQGAG